MQQHQLKPSRGATKNRKRVGRGDAAGQGSYSGKGIKGQKSRSGPNVRLGFAGGQLPLAKALPGIRGFTNIFRQEYSVVNLDRLSRFPANSEVTPQSLVQAGLVKDLRKPVKILGRGELDISLTVEAHRFSKSAREKIEATGGSARQIS